jgi:hypothetical protein
MKVPAKKKAPAAVSKSPDNKKQLQFPNRSRRVCIHCGAGTATSRATLFSDPMILSIAMTVYRKRLGYPQQHRAAPSLNICENCTVRAITGSPGAPRAESMTLLNTIRERLAGVYNSMLEANQQ